MAKITGNQFENGSSITWTTVDNNYIDDTTYLKGYEKWTFVALLRFAFQTGREARPSQQKLADIVGVSRKTMNEILQRLEEKGFLERCGVHKQTKTNIYRVVVPAEIEIEWKQKDLDRLKKRLGEGSEENVNYQPDPEPTPTPKEDKIPYKEIINYLNEKAETEFKDKAESHRKLIRGRWADGYRLDDFKKVIDNKTEEWLKDEYWSAYLRPSTLFAPKHFDNYLNQKPKKKKNLRDESTFAPSDMGEAKTKDTRYYKDPKTGKVYDTQNPADMEEIRKSIFEEDKAAI